MLALTTVMVGLVSWGQLAPAQAAQTSLTGLFRLQAGSWAGGVKGTYFRMLQPDGSTYLTNTDSTAADKTYTLLSPGTDGGLRTGAYQPTPNPAFASNGDALSGKVTAPTLFFGVKFATATNQTDPQTDHSTSVPTIYANGTSLSGNLSAFAASWNKQNFNQGSPKPDGTTPGFTKPVSGTYNPTTKAFTLTWRSLIVGGPFNNFTGEWHLTGTFIPSGGTSTPTPTPTHSTSPSRTNSAHSHTASAPATSTARQRSARSRHAATTRASLSTAAGSSASAGSTTGGAQAAGATSGSPVANSSVASKSSHAPWVIGGLALLVVLVGLVGYWFVRTRGSRA